MAAMRRSDRRTQEDDYAQQHPVSKTAEPLSFKELQQRYQTLKSRSTEIQGQLQQTQAETQAWETVVWHDLEQQVRRERQRAWNALCVVQAVREEQQLLTWQYQQAIEGQQQFQTLYQQSQQELYRVRDELKFERRSKASIKGWETRRKAENDRLKREIADMVQVLQQSMVREDEAKATLQAIAGRMDRIQNLVNGLDAEATSPKNLLEKFQKIWQAIQEILRE
jgi:chromosome segregation ATPase